MCWKRVIVGLLTSLVSLMKYIVKKYVAARRYYEIFKSLTALKQKRQRAAFTALRESYYERVWREAAHSVNAEIESLGYGYLRIKKEHQWTLVKEGLVMLDDHLTLRVAGNKPLVHRLLRENGCSVPRYKEYDLSTLDQAYNFLRDLKCSAVVKPASGTAAGRGVTTNITNKRQLHKASYAAAALNPKLLIEEQAQGKSFRLLYLGGEFIDAVQRDPPIIIGDGAHAIRELISLENIRRLSAEPITSVNSLTVDLDCKRTLNKQGLKLSTLPADGVLVTLKSVVNQNTCHENHSVRNKVDSSIINLGSKVMSIMKLEFGGLDIITSDLSVPLEESGGIINEVNTTPGLHHHMLIAEEEQKVPVATMVLEYIFKKHGIYGGPSAGI